MGEVIEMLVRIPNDASAEHFVKAMTITQLKRAWDSAQTDIGDPGCYRAEAIHAEMNRRGHGAYVVV